METGPKRKKEKNVPSIAGACRPRRLAISDIKTLNHDLFIHDPIRFS
jgi:hypothetical protein